MYLFERGIVQLNHLVEKGHVKSVKYFMNLGMKGNNLLTIIDIYDAIPRLWKDDSGLIQFLEVDLISFNTYFHISSKKIQFVDVGSRTIYDYFIKALQQTYDLQVRDGQNDYDFIDKELKEKTTRISI